MEKRKFEKLNDINYSIHPMPENEKQRFKAMLKQEQIIWHNRFIQIIDGIMAEYEWQRHCTNEDLANDEDELGKVANRYSYNKTKFLYFMGRAKYIGELLQLDPDAYLTEYSPRKSFMKPAGREQDAFEKMTAEKLSEGYRKFMRILQGIDEIIDYYQSNDFARDFDRKGEKQIKKLIPVFVEYRFYFSERVKLVAELIEENKGT